MCPHQGLILIRPNFHVDFAVRLLFPGIAYPNPGFVIPSKRPGSSSGYIGLFPGELDLYKVSIYDYVDTLSLFICMVCSHYPSFPIQTYDQLTIAS